MYLGNSSHGRRRGHIQKALKTAGAVAACKVQGTVIARYLNQ